MNALPVGIERVADGPSRQRYFDDLDRWGFDIAYTAFYAHLYEDVIGKLKEPYLEFVAQAHHRGHPACVQIQSTVCAGDRVGIEEAQYDIENNPQKWGEKGFFGSFASEEFEQYLEEITSIFVKEYRYDYVVFEEPMFRVDIPGTKDRFYQKMMEHNPAFRYPDAHVETTEYVAVQRAKADMLVDFYTRLVDHAKSIGAKKVGIMPWFFLPTIENTPPETLNTSCEIGRIAQIPGLDLLVARMQPDNIYADTMRTGDELRKSPALYHIELMAHGLGKDLIAVSNPTDEHTDYPSCPLIPYEFYRDCTLASIAAAPGGFTRHWYGQNYGKDDRHMEALTTAARCATRLGQPRSPVAFVFSYSGTRHAEPYTYETVFPFYLALAEHLAFEAHMPMLTFYADTLEENLALHPEVQVLVLDEHFPLSVDEMKVISRWLHGAGKRAVVAFGAGVGYAADPELAGAQPSWRSHPGVYELIGLRQEEDPQVVFDEPQPVRDVSRVRRSAFLGSEALPALTRAANVRRVFGSRASVLYEIGIDEPRIPVVSEWRDRTTVALFCGFGLSPETARAAEKAITYALGEVDAPRFLLDSCTDGIVWNVTANDYIAISNLSDHEGRATGRPGRANFWDCLKQRLLDDGDTEFVIPPRSFGVYRMVGRRSKFLDVEGACYLRSLVDGAGRAEIDIWAGRTTTFLLKASPKSIMVDGRSSTVTQEFVDGVCRLTLQHCPPGEHAVSLRW